MIKSVQLLQGVPQAIITANADIAVTTLYLCNRSANTVITSVFLVSNGSTDPYNNIVYNEVQIAGKDTLVIDNERLLLGSGDSIQANVDALSDNKIVATLSWTNI
jgi:hypothetical protein